ncbi:hypothetical protein TTRE_0000507801 [Trichuris trichiura]|uniref:Uncharacterized protein n=1 Tax=Trichuris trichiura TaxID=36087 RepID=A0A077Z9A0_TRITR|nr:hypothetical protein TTRE_0000507801 [Trichuris trichiura]
MHIHVPSASCYTPREKHWSSGGQAQKKPYPSFLQSEGKLEFFSRKPVKSVFIQKATVESVNIKATDLSVVIEKATNQADFITSAANSSCSIKGAPDNYSLFQKEESPASHN